MSNATSAPVMTREPKLYDDSGSSILSGIVSDIAARQRRVVDQRPNQTSVVNNVVNSSTGSVITLIEPVSISSGTSGTSGYVTFDASSYVDSGTRIVIVEFAYELSDPDSGDVVANVYARANSSSPEYEIARGRSSGNSDNNANVSQSMIPVDTSALSFDYSVEAPGFNLGWSLRLIGYIT